MPKPTKGVYLAPRSDEELDAAATITEADVKLCLAVASPEVRAMLTARVEVIERQWNESQHPRASDGEFTHSGGEDAVKGWVKGADGLWKHEEAKAHVIYKASKQDREEMERQANQHLEELQYEHGAAEMAWDGNVVHFKYADRFWPGEQSEQTLHFVKCESCGDIAMRHGEEEEPECFGCGRVQNYITNPAQREFEKTFFSGKVRLNTNAIT